MYKALEYLFYEENSFDMQKMGSTVRHAQGPPEDPHEKAFIGIDGLDTGLFPDGQSQPPDDRCRGALVCLSHHDLGGRGKVIGKGLAGDLERPAEEVAAPPDVQD
jgi:hypothetical protein